MSSSQLVCEWLVFVWCVHVTCCGVSAGKHTVGSQNTTASPQTKIMQSVNTSHVLSSTLQPSKPSTIPVICNGSTPHPTHLTQPSHKKRKHSKQGKHKRMHHYRKHKHRKHRKHQKRKHQGTPAPSVTTIAHSKITTTKTVVVVSSQHSPTVEINNTTVASTTVRPTSATANKDGRPSLKATIMKAKRVRSGNRQHRKQNHTTRPGQDSRSSSSRISTGKPLSQGTTTAVGDTTTEPQTTASTTQPQPTTREKVTTASTTATNPPRTKCKDKPTQRTKNLDPCSTWEQCPLHRSKQVRAWLNSLPACPCMFSRSLYYNSTLYDSLHQRYFNWRIINAKSEKLDFFKPTAVNCIRQLVPNMATTVATQQCCYGGDSKLITRGSGAGTPNLVAPEINHTLHELIDLMPLLLCQGDWTRYQAARPPNNALHCMKNPSRKEFREQVEKARHY